FQPREEIHGHVEQRHEPQSAHTPVTHSDEHRCARRLDTDRRLRRRADVLNLLRFRVRFDQPRRPQITVVLVNTQSEAKYSIKSDRSGRFEFVGLPPGDYTFEASAPGFATLKGKMTVAGRNVQRDLSLEV